MAKNNILQDIIFRSRNMKLNSKKLREKSGGVYINQYVDIGGIQQWITIRGDNPNNPILLFVHGGPGSPYTMFNPLISYWEEDRKSTRLNSSHVAISYAVFCL